MMTVAGNRVDCGDRRRLVERLAEVPWTSHVARLKLQIPARHVQADRVAVDVLQRPRRGNLEPAAVQRHYQLDLVMQVRGAWRVVDLASFGHHCIGRLEEEEWRLTLGILPHLACVRRVVASDAVDAMHREAAFLTGYGNRRRFVRVDNERICHLCWVPGK